MDFIKNHPASWFSHDELVNLERTSRREEIAGLHVSDFAPGLWTVGILSTALERERQQSGNLPQH